MLKQQQPSYSSTHSQKISTGVQLVKFQKALALCSSTCGFIGWASTSRVSNWANWLQFILLLFLFLCHHTQILTNSRWNIPKGLVSVKKVSGVEGNTFTKVS